MVKGKEKGEKYQPITFPINPDKLMKELLRVSVNSKRAKQIMLALVTDPQLDELTEAQLKSRFTI